MYNITKYIVKKLNPAKMLAYAFLYIPYINQKRWANKAKNILL